MIDCFWYAHRGHVGPLAMNRPYRYVDEVSVKEGIHQFLTAKLEESFEVEHPKQEGKIEENKDISTN